MLDLTKPVKCVYSYIYRTEQEALGLRTVNNSYVYVEKTIPIEYEIPVEG